MGLSVALCQLLGLERMDHWRWRLASESIISVFDEEEGNEVYVVTL